MYYQCYQIVYALCVCMHAAASLQVVVAHACYCATKMVTKFDMRHHTDCLANRCFIYLYCCCVVLLFCYLYLIQHRRGLDIVVGTPGRMKDHINRGNLDLSEVKHAGTLLTIDTHIILQCILYTVYLPLLSINSCDKRSTEHVNFTNCCVYMPLELA
jgi:hypothetical protein